MQNADKKKGNIYEKAGYILKDVERGKGKILTICLRNKTLKDNKPILKAVYGLVCETCKHNKEILSILKETNLLDKEKDLDFYVAKTLICDFLFKKRNRCTGDLKEILKRNRDTLRESFRNMFSEEKKPPSQMPVYIRVNQNIQKIKNVINHFEQNYDCVFISVKEKDSKDFRNSFFLDSDIPNLLVFKKRIDLSEDCLYKNGAIIFQSKASCFPVIALSPKKNSKVIDACAAPGNKTSQLSATMENKGKIFAFEKNKKRTEILRRTIERTQSTNVSVQEEDFLTCNPCLPQYKDVTSIIVDPSCSGSGMKESPEHFVLKKERISTITRNVESQKKILLHAMSFPGVTSIVYSTCSVYEEENEAVVESVLKSNKDFVIQKIFNNWKTRGKTGYSFSDSVVRTNPEQDLTTGFFVALFKRKIFK